MEGRWPVGRPKKTWSKVVEEDMRKLNITEDKVEATLIMSNPRSWKLGTVNNDDDDDAAADDDTGKQIYLCYFSVQ